jgi:hypothetical protein
VGTVNARRATNPVFSLPSAIGALCSTVFGSPVLKDFWGVGGGEWFAVRKFIVVEVTQFLK